MTLPNVSTTCPQKIVGECIARIRVADAHGFASHHSVRQVLTLSAVENRVLPKHGNNAWVSVFAVAILHLQLLDEVDPRSVLAPPHVAARFDCLLEREKAWRWPASITGEPQQDN